MLGGFIMNLTLKQLFKFGAACTCACALSATAATNYVADSFEVSDGGSDGLAISQYKYTVSGLNETNYSWVAESGDASTIVSNDAAYADITGDGPLTGDADLVLNLETEGNTLSRTVDVSIATGAYIDTLVQFTPSEDDPTIDTGTGSDVKVALFVNASSNLVVTHRAYSSDFLTTWTTNSVVDDVTIDAEKWYRLTMQVDSSTVPGFNTTKIWLDGTALSHTNALTSGYGFGGSYFAHIDTTEATIAKVGFQGTGMLDEFVVSDTMPDFGETTIEITLVAQGGAVTFSANPVNSGDTVTITATDDWKWLASIDGPVTEAGVVDADSITTTLTAVASCTVTAVVEYADADHDIGGTGYPIAGPNGIGTWADANGLTEAQVGEDQLDDYLLNVADGTNAELTIESITVDGTDVTIVVGNTDNANVDLDNINGTLKLYSTTTLGGTWTEVGSASIGSGNDTVQIDISSVANATDFFKAVVE